MIKPPPIVASLTDVISNPNLVYQNIKETQYDYTGDVKCNPYVNDGTVIKAS